MRVRFLANIKTLLFILAGLRLIGTGVLRRTTTTMRGNRTSTMAIRTTTIRTTTIGVVVSGGE